jgi:hypothetical protein
MVSGRSIPSREQDTTLRAVILLTLLISLGTSCAANRAWLRHALRDLQDHPGKQMDPGCDDAELKTLDLRSAVSSVTVPVLFALGRYDRVTESSLAEDYLAGLSAPSKCLVWFEGSAHNVPFEEPDRFNSVVIDYLSSARTNAEPRCASEHSATNTLRSGARVLRLSSGWGRPNSRPWPTRGWRCRFPSPCPVSRGR